jgi:uncharacterized membrane protein YfcA
VKSARAAFVVASLVTIVASGAGILLSDGVEDAIPPAAVLILTCISLWASLRRPLPPPKPWDRKRVVLTAALTVPVVAFIFGVALIPMIRQTEDSAVRVAAVVTAAIILASLALAVTIARREHRLAQNAGEAPSGG